MEAQFSVEELDNGMPKTSFTIYFKRIGAHIDVQCVCAFSSPIFHFIIITVG